MKILILLLISSIGLAKPLERNDYTKAHSVQLADAIGITNKDRPGAMIGSEDGFKTYTYFYTDCSFTYYVDGGNIIQDVEVNGTRCF